MTFITKGNKLFYAACSALFFYPGWGLKIRTCDLRPLSLSFGAGQTFVELFSDVNTFLCGAAGAFQP